MSDNRETLNDRTLAAMAGASVHRDAYDRLPGSAQERVGPTDMPGVATAVFNAILDEAPNWPPSDPRLAVVAELTTRLQVAIERPEGAQ